MARNLHKDPSISQKNDASCIGNKRCMAKRAKRNSNKRDRQRLKNDLDATVKLSLLESMLEMAEDYAGEHPDWPYKDILLKLRDRVFVSRGSQTKNFISSSTGFFSTGFPHYSDRSGQKVKVIRKLSDREADKEVGNMYSVQFSDGTIAHAFEDELK